MLKKIRKSKNNRYFEMMFIHPLKEETPPPPEISLYSMLKVFFDYGLIGLVST